MNNNKGQLYGIVEGFFSKPLPTWTQKQRLETLKFITEYAPNLNAYFYCPKQDPYIAARWQVPYPPIRANGLKQTIEFCERSGKRFTYGLNPSPPPKTRSAEYVERILRKLNQLLELGCTSFCLLYDDIPISYSLAENINDPKAVGVASSISYTTSAIFNYLSLQKSTLWLCSPDYFFRSKNPFNQVLLKNLDPLIPLIWTGPEVFVSNIINSQIAKVKGIVGARKLVFWLNYPVNDYPRSPGTLNLGGFPKLNPKLINGVEGIFANPMREAFLNFPFYITFDDWVKKGRTYDRKTSYSQALLTLLNNKLKPRWVLSLSSPNIVDPKPKYITREKLSLPNPKVVDNKYGRLFLQQLKDAIRKRKDSLFPINWRDPTYFPRSLAILRSRLTLVGISSTPEIDGLLSFKKKYQSLNKTQILRPDQKAIVNLLNSLIRKEAQYFAKAIRKMNSQEVFKLKKRRSSINEFNSYLFYNQIKSPVRKRTG